MLGTTGDYWGQSIGTCNFGDWGDAGGLNWAGNETRMGLAEVPVPVLILILSFSVVPVETRR